MSVTVSQQKNFVGGEWVDAVEGGTMEVVNPATGEAIAEVPRGTQADVDRAVEAAKKALPEWLETTPGARARGQIGGRVHARLHVDAPPRAAGDRRRDRALELPADDGDLEARPGAGRGQRPGAEAFRADPVDDAAVCGAGRRDPAGGCPERDHGRRRAGRRRDCQAPRRAACLPDG